MQYSKNNPRLLDLQLFADGAAGGSDTGNTGGTGVTGTAAASQQKGVKSNPLADVQYGIQPENGVEGQAAADNQSQDKPNPDKEFASLIEGQYKTQFQNAVQSIVQQRLKGSKKTADQLKALAPIIETVASKYGLQPDDVPGILSAMEGDDSYYERQALEQGFTVEQFRKIDKMNKEHAATQRELRERESREQADRQYNAWMQQAQAAKQVYPSFDIQAEMQNTEFVNLIRNNVDVKTAYEVIHKDDIIGAAMQHTAETVAKKVAANVAANGARPTENGLAGRSPAQFKRDVSQLTKADREEVARRVARGDRVTFG